MVVRTGWSLDKFGFAGVYGNGKESVEYCGDPKCCMRAGGDYVADQDCKVCEELGRAEI